LQLTSDVGLAIRFIIVSDFWKSNSFDMFPEIVLWWRSPGQQRLEILVSIFFPTSDRLMPMVVEGILSKWLLHAQQTHIIRSLRAQI
jgi:hypothetical protein